MSNNRRSANVSAAHEAYNLRHYVERCAEFQQYDEIKRCLSSFKYLRKKVKTVDPYSLIQDFEHVSGDHFFDEIRTAIELVVSILVSDPSQLGGQLIGRLGERRVFDDPQPDPVLGRFAQGQLTGRIASNIRQQLTGRMPLKIQEQSGEHEELVSAIQRNSRFPWFQPLFASLNPADSILSRRINSGIKLSDFVLLKDSRTCITLDSYDPSAAHPRRLSYYDITNGQTIFETDLPIQSGSYKMELFPNRSRLLIWYKDLLVWDVENRQLMSVLQYDKSANLERLMCTPEGDRLVQCFSGGSIRILDFAGDRNVNIQAASTASMSFGKAIQVSPDGRLLAVGGENRSIELWDTLTGNKVREHDNHPHQIIEVDFSLDNLWLKTVSDPMLIGKDRDDSKTLYWNLQTYEIQKSRPPGSYYRREVLTRDFKTAFKKTHKPSKGTVEVIDVSRQDVLYSFRAHSHVIGKLEITADDLYLVSIADDKGLSVWDAQAIINTPEKVELYRHLLPHSDQVMATAITTDAKYGVTASWDGTITIWDMLARKVKHRLQQVGKKANYVVAITPDDETAIIGGDEGALCGWNIERGTVSCVFSYHPKIKHEGKVNAIAIHPSSSTPILISGAGEGFFRFLSLSGKGELKLWNYLNSKHIYDLYIGDEQIRRVVLSPDGSICVVGTGETLSSSDSKSSLFVIDLEQGNKNTIELKFKAVGDIAFSDDGRFFSVSEGSLVSHEREMPIAVVLRTDTLEIVYECFLDDSAGYIESLKFTHDSTLLLAGIKGISKSDSGHVVGWDVTNHEQYSIKPSRVYIGHLGEVNQIEITSDDRYLLSTAEDQTIKLWDLKGAKALATFKTDAKIQHFSIASDDQTILAGSADGRVHIFKFHV
ncbi:MAG: hypothetical protein AAFP20_00815 [Cyanobacteria bacterium J06614_10]